MKNLLMKHKRIFGVAIVVLVAFMFVPVGYAEEDTTNYCVFSDSEDEKNQRLDLEQTVLERYNIKVTQGSDANHFTIKMNPRENRTERCKVKFKLTKVNGNSITYDPTRHELSCSHAITDIYVSDADLSNVQLTSGLPRGFQAELYSQKIVKAEEETDSCYYRDVVVRTEKSVASSGQTYGSGSCHSTTPISVLQLRKIDCSHPAAGFETEFCAVKNAAIAEGNDYSSRIVGEKYDTSHFSTLNFKCNTDVKTIPVINSELKGNKYFVNKKHVYASGEVTRGEEVIYYAHYSPYRTATVIGTASCKLECEEAVTIEYGPPVAIRAGLCFEYKVRVTSRVSCHPREDGDGNVIEIPKPPQQCSWCTPTPLCTGQWGSFRQGGPNEDFDNCVKACDGGKYTKNCSNKCYKEVYGADVTAQAKINSELLDVSATRLTTANAYNQSQTIAQYEKYKDRIYLNDGVTLYDNVYGGLYGVYYRTSGGSILWSDSGARHWNSWKEATGEGRWYTEHPGGKYHTNAEGRFIIPSDETNGFWRKVYSSGDHCHDNCRWLRDSCGTNQYLNPGSGWQDYEDNLKAYNGLILKCNAAASCSTSQATFTISANYKKMDGEELTYYFPYDGTAANTDHYDKIKPYENSTMELTTANNPNTTIYKDFPSVGNGVWGCYNENDTENRTLYRTTWGFPGSWMDGKKAQISYTKPSDEGWIEFDKKFCVPGDAEDVNSVWWIQRMKYISEKKGISGTSYSSADYTSGNCSAHSEHFAWSTINTSHELVDYVQTYYPTFGIKWNIKAETREFGFFDWPIDIQCFFSISSVPSCLDDCCITDSCRTITTDAGDEGKYLEVCVDNDDPYVRPVDSEEMFPERNPRFNWSDYAINYKNTAFPNNPKAYRERIQSLGTDGIYDDKYLDYDFHLEPKDLREIRKGSLGLTSNTKYTAFDPSGFYADSQGMYRYCSNYLRGIGGSNTLPTKDNTQCNNMLGLNQTGCDPVHGS